MYLLAKQRARRAVFEAQHQFVWQLSCRWLPDGFQELQTMPNTSKQSRGPPTFKKKRLPLSTDGTFACAQDWLSWVLREGAEVDGFALIAMRGTTAALNPRGCPARVFSHGAWDREVGGLWAVARPKCLVAVSGGAELPGVAWGLPGKQSRGQEAWL